MRDISEYINRYQGKIAAIFGAGQSLLEVESSWFDGTYKIALNSALDWRDDLNAVFFTDWNIPNSKFKREYAYYQKALADKKLTKFLLSGYFKSDINRPDVVPFICGAKEFKRLYTGQLMGGASVLMPVLHFCFIAGFKYILLSGCDYAIMKNGKNEYQTHWYGNVGYGFKIKDSFNPAKGWEVKAPNEEKVIVTTALNKQMMKLMPRIRQMQDSEIKIFKTSTRGMMDIPYLNEFEIKELCNSLKK